MGEIAEQLIDNEMFGGGRERRRRRIQWERKHSQHCKPKNRKPGKYAKDIGLDTPYGELVEEFLKRFPSETKDFKRTQKGWARWGSFCHEKLHQNDKVL